MYQSERVKKSMSGRAEGSVQIEALSEGADFNCKVSSSRVDADCHALTAPLKAAVQKLAAHPGQIVWTSLSTMHPTIYLLSSEHSLLLFL